MAEKIDSKEWANDFNFFLNAPEVRPPQHLQQSIFGYVHADLNPTFWKVFAKLGGIHIFIGSLSLLICEQFGMGRGTTVMDAFMGFGPMVCMGFCGALFLGLTVLIAGFILSNSELVKIRKSGYSPIAILGLVSLVVFFCFGASIAMNFAIAWLLGAIAAGAILTEISIGIKKPSFT